MREVQRALRFSSSSTAQYHLAKLEETGLVAKDGQGTYSVVRRVQLGPMKDFASIAGRLIPKDFLYALVMTLLSIIYVVLLQSYFSSTLVLLALLPNVVSAAIFWYETWGTLKTRPSFKK